jgi:hypothetical protein
MDSPKRETPSLLYEGALGRGLLKKILCGFLSLQLNNVIGKPIEKVKEKIGLC